MADYKLIWDEVGEHKYETGVSHGVLYPFNETSKEYKPGVVWNGLSSVTENPSGAEPTAIYADNIKYLNLISAEDFGGTIEAFTYPDEFAACDGTDTLTTGVTIGQQARKKFGFSYQTKYGDDSNPEAGYKIHLVYGAKASPSQRQYETINESPNAMSLSWEFTTEPVKVTGKKDTAVLTIDAGKLNANQKKAIEEALYGKPASGSTEAVDAYLPLPDEVLSIISNAPTPTPNPTPELTEEDE